jgi:FtsP/CotA-like multicopper oxidase with cupredoxin domain
MKHTKVLMTLSVIAVIIMAASVSAAATRWYYIQAEDVVWEFAPTGLNQIHCLDGPTPCAIPEPFCTEVGSDPPVPIPNCAFNKVRYIQYKDATFAPNQKVPQPEWLGVLGPIIRAEVGDTVKIHFKNNSTAGSFGMHPHGFRYTKDNEGAFYTGVNSGQGPGAGTQIPPGGEFIYTWIADADSGPGLGETSSKVWWYHSHVDEPFETNLGLLGPIIITRKGFAKPDGSPIDVDQEFVVSFFVMDELAGEENGLMHGMNGYIFGNLKGLVMRKGDKVRWHLLGMGNEVDLHTPHWHGKTVRVGNLLVGRRTDVIELLPATMVTAEMTADNVGEWLFHCHVADHINAGMLTTYQILP